MNRILLIALIVGATALVSRASIPQTQPFAGRGPQQDTRSGADSSRAVTITQGELDDLQRELDRLASEVAALKAQVARMKGPSRLPAPPKMGETADDARIFLRDHRNTCHLLSDTLVSGGEQWVIAVFSPAGAPNQPGARAGTPIGPADLRYVGKLRVTIKNGWIDQTAWEPD